MVLFSTFKEAVLGAFTRTICENIENPTDAYMFAESPKMIDEIIDLRSKVAQMESIINMISSNLSHVS